MFMVLTVVLLFLFITMKSYDCYFLYIFLISLFLFIPEDDNEEEIPIKYQNIYEECMEYFQLMYRQRLKI